jgi:hypothetical protein
MPFDCSYFEELHFIWHQYFLQYCILCLQLYYCPAIQLFVSKGANQMFTANDYEILDAAIDIGLALNKDRALEDSFRSAGKDEEANAIYLRNKQAAQIIFSRLNITGKEFDTRLAKLTKNTRKRINVKLERLFD